MKKMLMISTVLFFLAFGLTNLIQIAPHADAATCACFYNSDIPAPRPDGGDLEQLTQEAIEWCYTMWYCSDASSVEYVPNGPPNCWGWRCCGRNDIGC